MKKRIFLSLFVCALLCACAVFTACGNLQKTSDGTSFNPESYDNDFSWGDYVG